MKTPRVSCNLRVVKSQNGLNSAGALPSLAKLLHWERCEALQALAVVLRGAHDDGHPFAAQCRELSERLLSQDLEKKLWELYVKALRAVRGMLLLRCPPAHAFLRRRNTRRSWALASFC